MCKGNLFCDQKSQPGTIHSFVYCSRECSAWLRARMMWSQNALSTPVLSDVDTYFRTRRRGCRRVCLSGTLRALNYILAICGVLMISWDFFAYIEWAQEVEKDKLVPPADQPPGFHSAHIPQLESPDTSDFEAIYYSSIFGSPGDAVSDAGRALEPRGARNVHMQSDRQLQLRSVRINKTECAHLHNKAIPAALFCLSSQAFQY